MLNNMVEVSKVNPDMTDEIMYKTCVQFFSDGYESASQVDNEKTKKQRENLQSSNFICQYIHKKNQ